LGPFIFLAADNLQSLVGLFADDTSLFFTSNSDRDTEIIMKHDLRIIKDWWIEYGM